MRYYTAALAAPARGLQNILQRPAPWPSYPIAQWNTRLNKNVWFRPESLFRLTDSTTWSRGMALFRGQRSVSGLHLERVGNHWVISGKVQGGQPRPYELTIKAWLSPLGEVLAWNGLCSCPVGGQC